jgi:hypothetical protein
MNPRKIAGVGAGLALILGGVSLGAASIIVPAQREASTGRISEDSPTYLREAFGTGWRDPDRNGCDARNDVLNRDLRSKTVAADGCIVENGVLDDPYTGRTIGFIRGVGTSDDVQIDHLVALADAYRHGASEWSRERRVEFANDQVNLQSTEGRENLVKSDRGPSSWSPPNATYRCTYAQRYSAVKAKWRLSYSAADSAAIDRLLATCKAPE